MKRKDSKKNISHGKGKVFLAGAGPGDPELLTLKTKRILGEADVIVYDSLISEEILSYAKKGCEIIYAGKRSSNHTLHQYSINELLSEKASGNKTVLRLKGGDPYLFGRGGEEAEKLFDDGVPFEVIPGISSSFAVPAYAGIPLTHRDYASTVAIVTGHEGEHKDKSTIDWAGLAGADTIVVLMGYKNLGSITNKIIKAGKPAGTPSAVIQEGTTLNQKAVTGKLGDIASIVKKEGLQSPLILIVGKVVKLRKTLNWFENRPLSGLKVMVTRSEGQAGTLADKLKSLGAYVINLPLIKVLTESPAINEKAIIRAISKINDYEYIIFTSANAVSGFFSRLMARGIDARAFTGNKIIAVGKVSSHELGKFGIIPDVVPEEPSQEGIIKALQKANLKGKKILFPQALKINPDLPDFLKKKGAILTNLAVYETVLPEESRDAMREIFGSMEKTGKNIGLPGKLDMTSFMITFTSYSTVENFVSAAESINKGLLRKIIKSGVKFASIGVKTADYAFGFGIKSDIISKEVTIDSMIDGIISFYSRKTDAVKPVKLKKEKTSKK